MARKGLDEMERRAASPWKLVAYAMASLVAARTLFAGLRIFRKR